MSVSEDPDSDQGVEQTGARSNLTKDSSSGFATSTTAAGRIEANRHWLSDTLGGAALAMIFVSVSVTLCHYLEGRGDNDLLE